MNRKETPAAAGGGDFFTVFWCVFGLLPCCRRRSWLGRWFCFLLVFFAFVFGAQVVVWASHSGGAIVSQEIVSMAMFFSDLFSWPRSLSSLSYVMVDMVPLYFHSIFWTTLLPVTAIFMVDMFSCASLSPFSGTQNFFLVTAFSWWTWSLCVFF